MHNHQTTRQFIERRSKGESCASIAEDIGVSRSTLFEWNRKYSHLIRSCSHEAVLEHQSFSVSELEETLGNTANLHAYLRRTVDRDLAQLDELSIEKRILLTVKLQKEMDRLRHVQTKELKETHKALNSSSKLLTPDPILDIEPEPEKSDLSPQPTMSTESTPSDPSEKSENWSAAQIPPFATAKETRESENNPENPSTEQLPPTENFTNHDRTAPNSSAPSFLEDFDQYLHLLQLSMQKKSTAPQPPVS